ncbi:MAG: phosphate/phosphite/phosphonate ABC transporter substrate-binding protein [Gemmataceae bacterium]
MVNRHVWCGLLLILAGLLFAATGHAQETLKAGICNSFFTDIPDGKAKGSIKQFEDYLRGQTEQQGEFVKIKDPIELADRMGRGDLHLGVFHGYEFAWAMKRDPKLKILVLAVNDKIGIHAHIYVNKDSKIASFADLKGKSLAIPEYTRAFCKFYLARTCEKNGTTVDNYFGKVTRPQSVEDGLDDVVDGVVDAVICDEVAAAGFQERKAVRFAKLKKVDESPAFPTGVIAYHEGSVTERAVDKMYKALKGAKDNADGKQILLNWRMTSFEDAPKDFHKLLEETLERYPPPKK